MAFDIDYFLSLVPSWNAKRPNFMTVLRNLVEPLVSSQQGAYDVLAGFDLDTAVGVQLDQVGLWIGQSRNILVPLADVFFSWDTSGLGWEEGYWDGNSPPSGVTSLDDAIYRRLLKAKALANRWDGTILGAVAPYEALVQQTVYIEDNEDMTMTVIVTGAVLPPIIEQLLTLGYVPVKPVGVAISYTVPV